MLELYFGETLLKKDSKIIVPKKKELYFFWELYFGETLFEKVFQNYSSGKKGTIFFELYFGETPFEKGFQNYSSKKKRINIFFWNYILVKHVSKRIPKL